MTKVQASNERAWHAARERATNNSQQIARLAAEKLYGDFADLFQRFEETQREMQPSSTKVIEGRVDMTDEDWEKYAEQYNRKVKNAERAKNKVLQKLRTKASPARDGAFVDWIKHFSTDSDKAAFQTLTAAREKQKAEQLAEAERRRQEKLAVEKSARLKAEVDRRRMAQERRSRRVVLLQEKVTLDRSRCLSEDAAKVKKRRRHVYVSKDPTHEKAARLEREGELEDALEEYRRLAREAKQEISEFKIRDIDDNKILTSAGDNHFAQGTLYEKLGKPGKALEAHKFALEVREKRYVGKPYHPNIAISVAGIALAHAKLGNPKQSSKSVIRSLRIVDTAAGKEGSTSAECLRLLGKVCHAAAQKTNDGKERRAQYKTALEYYHRSIKIYETIGGAREVELDLAITLNSVGSLLHERNAEGDFDDGWIMYERARDIFERVEPDHLHVAMVLYNLASHHERQDEFVVAERYYRRALQQRIMEDYDEHLPWVLLQYPWVGEKIHEARTQAIPTTT